VVKNIFKIVIFFIIGMVGGIFADQIFWPYFVERPLFYQYRLEQAPINVTERKEITVQENIALRNAIEKVGKAVVGVRAKTKTGAILEGSGLIVSSDGLIVTLADLVPSSSDINFFWDGKLLSFQILKRDLEENLALVKTEETNLPTTGFADLERIELGERVFLAGVILKKDGTPKKAVNEGIIKTFDGNSIETNIFEESTFSGSPLFNIEGNALGLNIVNREGKVTAIPISKIRQFAGF